MGRFSKRGVPVLNLKEKVAALQECIENDSTEDSIGHLFDLMNLVVPGYSFVGDTWSFKNITELCAYYGSHPTPIKGGKMQIMSGTHRLIHEILKPVWDSLYTWDFYPFDEVNKSLTNGLPDCDVYVRGSNDMIVLSVTIEDMNMWICIAKEDHENGGRNYNISDPKSIERARSELCEWFDEIKAPMTWAKWVELIDKWLNGRES